jgi:ABC-type uncharacterized transport system ATPase subunit
MTPFLSLASSAADRQRKGFPAKPSFFFAFKQASKNRRNKSLENMIYLTTHSSSSSGALSHGTSQLHTSLFLR